jgi:pseudouridine kinase
MEMKDILVIGGSNIDYSAASFSPLIRQDSNIGHLNISFGGVARNVTENLAYLNDKVTFITAIGNDAGGQRLRRDLRALKVKVLAYEDPNCPTASYLAINDNKGEMDIAVCDSRIQDTRASKDYAIYNETIRKHHDIVLDANLSEPVIDWLFDSFFSHNFLVEGVSTEKIVRYRKHLSNIYLLKMNYLEAKCLMNEEKDIHDIAADIINAGVKNVVISNGSKPIVCGNSKRIVEIPIVPVTSIVNDSGAGDALFAGIVHQLNRDKNLETATRFGGMLAKVTLQVQGSVNPDVHSLLKFE